MLDKLTAKQKPPMFGRLWVIWADKPNKWQISDNQQIFSESLANGRAVFHHSGRADAHFLHRPL